MVDRLAGDLQRPTVLSAPPPRPSTLELHVIDMVPDFGC